MEEVEIKGDEKSHPLSEVPGSGGEHEVDGVSGKAFEVVAGHAVVMFEVSDDWFDGASAAEPSFHGSDLVGCLILGF